MSIEIATLLAPLAGAAIFAYFTINYDNLYTMLGDDKKVEKNETKNKRQLYLTLTFLCLLIVGAISHHMAYGVTTNTVIIQIVSSVFFYLMGFVLLIDVLDFIKSIMFSIFGAADS